MLALLTMSVIRSSWTVWCAWCRSSNSGPGWRCSTFRSAATESASETLRGIELRVRTFDAVVCWLCARRCAGRPILDCLGFESRFCHVYEEPDYSPAMLRGGLRCAFLPRSITIRRPLLPGMRVMRCRIHHRHARNEFWSTLMRCPLPFAVGMIAWRVFSQLRYACGRGWSWVVREPVWWCEALTGIPYCVRKRRPVSWAGYKRWLSLP